MRTGTEHKLARFGHKQATGLRIHLHPGGGDGGDFARIEAHRASGPRALVCFVTSWGLDVVSRGQSGDAPVHSHWKEPHNETLVKNAQSFSKLDS